VPPDVEAFRSSWRETGAAVLGRFAHHLRSRTLHIAVRSHDDFRNIKTSPTWLAPQGDKSVRRRLANHRAAASSVIKIGVNAEKTDGRIFSGRLLCKAGVSRERLPGGCTADDPGNLVTFSAAAQSNRSSSWPVMPVIRCFFHHNFRASSMRIRPMARVHCFQTHGARPDWDAKRGEKSCCKPPLWNVSIVLTRE